MGVFTARVELHGVAHDGEEYEVLHKAMRSEGFSRTIKKSGVVYQLPPAEYNFMDKAETETEAVLERAKRAAQRTRKTHAIIVTKSDGPREIFGLEPLKT